jgi:long-chain acyl-CoA synthetase
MALAAGLLELGIHRGDRVAVFAENSVGYAIAVFAILSIGAVFVPVYPTTTAVEAENIVNHSGAKLIFAGNISQYQKALPVLNRVKTPLKKMIAMYPAQSPDPGVIELEDLIKQGGQADRTAEVIEILKSVAEGDIAALIYTTSSPASPRGALLSHGNFIAQRKLVDIFGLNEKDVHLAHLPFGHIFGLMADLFSSAASGATLVICKTFETGEILQYIKETRPTVICSVPRLYEKMYTDIVHMNNSRPAFTRSLYRTALRTGRDCFIKECEGKRPERRLRTMRLLLRPVFASIKRALSLQKTRLLISAGGLLPVQIAHLAGGLGLPIIEGYGLTETLPIINVNPPGQIRPGTLGPPLADVEERIAEDGEVLVKGPMVFRGYYNNDRENGLAFTEDGFYRTGDMGQFDEDGYLTITGRIKDRIVLSSGKIIRPRNIEKHFEHDAWFNYFCVVGDNSRYVSALVCPNRTMLREYAKEHRIPFTDDDDLLGRKEVFDLYKKKVAEVNGILPNYEQVKKFTLMRCAFSIESGEITPTFKLRRQYIHEKYRDVIDSMYPESGKAIRNL